MNWITKTIYVDSESGEILTQDVITMKTHHISKTIKDKTSYNERTDTATRTFIYECKRYPQLKLF